MISPEEREDAANYVEDMLAEGVGEIEDMMRRKASHIALTLDQRKRIQFALDVLNKIEVQR